MKRLFIAIRVLVLLILLFVPSFAVMVAVAFFTGQTRWFGYIGLPVLLVNAAIVFAKPQRDRIWRWASTIAGTSPRV